MSFTKYIFGLAFFASTAAFAQNTIQAPGVVPSPSAIPAAVTSKITSEEKSQLLVDFQMELGAELQKVQTENQREMRNLDAALKSRYREWVIKEKAARHEYFTTHPDLKRAEKRAYIQDYQSREKAFLTMEREERQQLQTSQDSRLESVKSDQAAHVKEFNSYLERGVRPPPWLR